MKRQPKAKTAYELLERVCEHILEEPRRYHQGLWGFEIDPDTETMLDMPPCGTVCCRAGWVVALHDGPDAIADGGVADRSNKILGLTDDDTNEIYYDDRMEKCGAQGTKAYAKAGVSGLRLWMKKHKAHLQGRTLKGV